MQSMLALSASRRDGQGFYRMDVSSSLITVERTLWEGYWDRRM